MTDPGAATVVGIFLLTFVSEDAATVTAAVLASLGKFPVLAAYITCWLGIWIGDLALYLIARRVGRPLLDRWRWQKLEVHIERSEQWFARYGMFALVICRLIPGTRLPTFLTAGFLRMPILQFAVVTAVLATIWAAVVFWLVMKFGDAASEMLRDPRAAAVGFVTGALIVLVLTRTLWGRLVKGVWQRPVIQRWLRWEFWPPALFYLPVALHYLILSVRFRGLTVPTCANPGMFTGGFVGESKHETLNELEETSPEWTAPSFLIAPGPAPSRYEQLRSGMLGKGIDYPVVLKPDVAQRGSGFRVARNEEAAEAYLAAVQVPVVAQQYVSGPHEAGIFYFRFPDQPRGQILAITEKCFPVIFGDGDRTVEQLIRADARAAIVADVYLARLGSTRSRVLAFGEPLRLVEAGNHAQGCIFRDGMHLWSEALEQRFDEISQRISGFFIGRYDVRYSSPEELMQGRGFQILELNGAASEATSAYDAGKSLFAAYRLLFRQWRLVFSIGAANRRAGHKASPLSMLWTEWRRYRETSMCHPVAD